MRKLNYKKLSIWGISLLIIAIIVTSIIFIVKSKNKPTVVASSDDVPVINNINVPNVTKENTSFKLSDTKNKAQNINISATNRLDEYNLYYCLKYANNANSKIQNEDYLVFNDLLLVLYENCSILFKYELNGSFSDEAYEIKISNIEAAKITEKATEKELKEEKVDKKDKTQATSPYFIKVNYGANAVTIYSKDADGNYTVPFKSMVCSCGTYTPTSGTYKITNKYVWRPLIDNVYGHYATRIVGQILFHSVPYTSSSNDTLEYWEYDKLGQTASAGCVRLTVRDAKWIYNNCPSGTMVEFYSNSNPGPLGKPSAQKISSNEECRNWDPTDPATGNPWHTYKEKQETPNTNNNAINNNVVTNNTTNNSIVNNITNNNITNNITNNSITNSIINNNVTDNSVTNNTIINNATTNNSVTNNTVINNSVNNSITNNTINNSVTNNAITNNTTTNTNNVITNNSVSKSENNTVTNNTINKIQNNISNNVLNN